MTRLTRWCCWAGFTRAGELAGVAVRTRFGPPVNWVVPGLTRNGSRRARAGTRGGGGDGSSESTRASSQW